MQAGAAGSCAAKARAVRPGRRTGAKTVRRVARATQGRAPPAPPAGDGDAPSSRLSWAPGRVPLRHRAPVVDGEVAAGGVDTPIHSGSVVAGETYNAGGVDGGDQVCVGGEIEGVTEGTAVRNGSSKKAVPGREKAVPGSVTVARSQVYQVITISANGETSYDVVQRRRLLADTGLRPRDLRRIDPTLSSFNASPAMLIRDNVVLLNLGSIRAIVGSNYAYLFQPNSADAQYFLDVITSRLKSVVETLPEDVAPTSFGIEVIEAALLAVTGQLDAELMSVTPKVDSLLRGLPGRITPEALESLRQVKQQLVNFESRVDAFKELCEDLLEEDEDIRQISIVTRGGEASETALKLEDARTSEDVMDAVLEMEEEEEEVEMLLEYYLQVRLSLLRARACACDGPFAWGALRGTGCLDFVLESDACARMLRARSRARARTPQRLEALHSEAERMLEAARETEDSIALTLSNRRFEINRLELILSIATLPVAVGALVSGIFGMNLQSTLEMSVVAFYLCTACIVVGAVLMFFGMYSWAKRRRIL